MSSTMIFTQKWLATRPASRDLNDLKKADLLNLWLGSDSSAQLTPQGHRYPPQPVCENDIINIGLILLALNVSLLIIMINTDNYQNMFELQICIRPQTRRRQKCVAAEVVENASKPVRRRRETIPTFNFRMADKQYCCTYGCYGSLAQQ